MPECTSDINCPGKYDECKSINQCGPMKGEYEKEKHECRLVARESYWTTCESNPLCKAGYGREETDKKACFWLGQKKYSCAKGGHFEAPRTRPLKVTCGDGMKANGCCPGDDVCSNGNCNFFRFFASSTYLFRVPGYGRKVVVGRKHYEQRTGSILCNSLSVGEKGAGSIPSAAECCLMLL